LIFFGVLQNNIPVYCPGLTDGSLGDMLYFHSFHNTGSPDNRGLNVDIVQGFYSILFTLYCMDDFETIGIITKIIGNATDIRAMNGEAVHADPMKTGMIILGGGLPKHHICNANMMRNGADYAVFINTAQEFDGSDSGAHPDEAVSWGKIRGSAKTVKVHPIYFRYLFSLQNTRNFCRTISLKTMSFYFTKPGTL
jgi:deoxyhypusine synthase